MALRQYMRIMLGRYRRNITDNKIPGFYTKTGSFNISIKIRKNFHTLKNFNPNNNNSARC